MLHKEKQIRIGLTGGIGSGKTFVGVLFSKLGIPVFNADFEAKRCMVENKILKNEYFYFIINECIILKLYESSRR